MTALPPPPPPEPPAHPPLPDASYHGVYAGQLPELAYAGMYATAMPFGAPVRRQRTAWIVVAQILMVVKGVLWLIAGIGIGTIAIYVLLHGADLHPAPGSPGYRGLEGIANGLAGVAVAFAVTAGVFFLAVGVADIALGVTLGRPSNVARWFTVALTTVAGVIAAVGIVGQAGNHAATAGGAVFLAVWLAVNVVIFYALVIDEPSRQAFG